MGGHVFIIRGDLTRLYCDAWLLPTDYSFEIMEHWRKVPGLEKGWTGPASEAWENGTSRVLRIEDWDRNKPRPWLVHTGGGPFATPQWHAEGVREFVRTAARDLRNRQDGITKRAKPLLALPFPGTGAGGARDRAGDLLPILVKTLHEESLQEDVDIAFTTNKGGDYAAAMHARKCLEGSGTFAWPSDLSAELKGVGKSLADSIKEGGLVLFLGSGVSAGAGLPTWDGLLEKLAIKAGVFNCEGADSERTRQDFKRLNYLDQAHLISDLFVEMKQDIGQEIAKQFSAHTHYALAHAILAAMQVNEIITTNYDTLFEEASAVAGMTPPRVLPYNPTLAGNRWLLKLHGCVTRPKDIVLTRSDYLRYDDKRAALKGIVQAMLMTRHMLFVGFSLRDENFEKIIDDVRKAIRGDLTENPQDEEVPFTTTLMPSTNSFLQKLWRKDVNWVNFERSGGLSESARLQEIFLDYLASISTSYTAHLIDPRYDGVLSEGEKALREALLELVDNVGEEVKNTPAWGEVEALFRRLGG